MAEAATSGSATLLPGVIQSLMLTPHNREAMARLGAAVRNRRG